ncbi:antibiotic resistance protein VanZ [Rhizobium sp. Leaf371]|uniref:VanZ family protein n=1 Tax=unclassified Rhizobium TaxID=2613769 RepID=UPI000715D5B5|nr:MULTISPECIES: VanZ family protein [unclassified Rhizobium]KQS67995.1 antibiotic resistance protein VanZ [Rhizobium sp. Leaf371]TCM57749.1 VanZ like protein [Rhizobium sp. PP-F2F-G48]
MTLRSLFRAAAWAALLVLVFVTVSPIGWRPHTVTEVGIDRAAAFALAGAIFAIAYPRRWLSLAVFLIAAAFFIEMLQWISPTRHAEVSDAVVKSIGSVVGLALGKLALVARRRWFSSDDRAPDPAGRKISRDAS